MNEPTNSNEKILHDKEYQFINTFNNDLNILKNKITNQKEKSNLIMSLLHSLTDYITTNKTEYENNKDEITSLIDNIEVNSKRITNNIKSFNSLEETINILNTKLSDLFTKAHSSKQSETYYINQINKMQNELNLYSFQINDIKTNILLNDVQLNNFFYDSTFNKYVNKFNIKLDNFKSDSENVLNTNLATTSIDTSETENTIYKKIECNNNLSEIFNHNNLTNNIENVQEFHRLLISEKENKVYLPYSKSEIKDYLEQYPNKYYSSFDVISNEFIVPLSYFQNHPAIARFRESYSLVRDREMKSIFEALKYAVDLMFKCNLNPAIIAACKTQNQLENYLDCLERNQLEYFKDFEIKFEINPF